MTLIEARDKLVDLLRRWKAGTIEDPWHVQDDAEAIESKLIENGLINAGKEKLGIAAQVDGVLEQLANAHAQYVLPKDIDAMLELLNACEDEIAGELALHNTYWNSIDFDAREVEVKRYWYIRD